MKENGINVRTYQDGKPFEFEVSTVYSKSLEFVAVHVNKDMSIKYSDCKYIEVKHGNDILFNGKFKYMDIITNATDNSIVYDLVIFHNGNIQFIVDYLKINEFDKVNSKINKFIRESKRTKIVPKEYVNTDVYFNVKLNRIPSWIRYLFNAS